MSDLISRKALFDELFVRNGKICPDIDVCNFPITFSARGIKNAIRIAPTAYDMDKVIAQLEELAEQHPYKVIGNPDSYSQYNEGWQDCIDRVTDIVKRGGIDEQI